MRSCNACAAVSSTNADAGRRGDASGDRDDTASVRLDPQTVDGVTYEFESWSDGGAASHTAPASDTTLTARFTGAATTFDARDIGAPALSGSTVEDGGTYTVTGAGKTSGAPATTSTTHRCR